MENLKIKVSSEAESKEAQELFFKLGYEKGVCSVGCYPAVIVAKPFGLYKTKPYSSRATSMDNEAHRYFKEITLPELRDIVVLKRNDVVDATHTDPNEKESLYFRLFGDWWNLFTGGRWQQFCHMESPRSAKLKPIEKPMKEPKQAEFLVKTDSGYVLQVLDENAGGADMVRVPDGATAYVNVFEFGQWDAGFYDFSKKQPLVFCDNEWTDFNRNYPTLQSLVDGGDVVLWRRETLNDQVASAEAARQSVVSDHDLIFGRGVLETMDIREDIFIGTTAMGESTQGKSEFPLSNYELNHRVAKAFNAVRGTNLNEGDVNYIRELIDLTVSHYGERK